MKPEVQLYHMTHEEPDLLILAGSRLYGSHRENSDYDYRGFVLPPMHYLMGFAQFNEQNVEGADHKIYSLEKFIKLLLMGDPHATEILFAPESHIIRITEIGRKILSMRELIVSQNIYHRITGFAYSEWRKAMAQGLKIQGRTKTEDTVIQDISNVFGPAKDDMDTILDILWKNKERKLVDSKRKLGEKRKNEVDQHGFGLTSATHSIRLVQEVSEILETGFLTLPRPNAAFLRSIRSGEVAKEEVEKIYHEEHARAQKAIKNTTIRKKPDMKQVWKEYQKIVVDFIDKNIEQYKKGLV